MNMKALTRRLALVSITLVHLAGAARSDDVRRVEIEPRQTLEGHGADVYCVAFSADGSRLATGSFDRTARLWDVESGTELAVLGAHKGKVMAVAFAPDGQLVATGSQDKSIMLWAAPPRSVPSGSEGGKAGASTAPKPVRTLAGHKSYVQALAFEPGGKVLASAGGDKTVRLWNVEDGKEQRSIEAHASSVYCIGFSPDGSLLASGGLDTQVKIWNVADGKELKVCSGHLEGVFALCFSGDGKFIYSGSADRTLRKWGVSDGKELARYELHPEWVCGLGLLPGEKVLVSADYGGHILTWDVESRKRLTHRRLNAVIFGATVSRDGRLVALGSDRAATFLVGATPE